MGKKKGETQESFEKRWSEASRANRTVFKLRNTFSTTIEGHVVSVYVPAKRENFEAIKVWGEIPDSERTIEKAAEVFKDTTVALSCPDSVVSVEAS